MKGRIFIVALLVLVLASLSYGQIIKYPIGDAAVGVVVQASGAAATDPSAHIAAGIVAFNDEAGNALVVSSGIVPLAGAAGQRFTFGAGGALVAVNPDVDAYQPVVAIGLGDQIMVTINMDHAVATQYDHADFLGAGHEPTTVNEALNLISDALDGIIYAQSDFIGYVGEDVDNVAEALTLIHDKLAMAEILDFIVDRTGDDVALLAADGIVEAIELLRTHLAYDQADFLGIVGSDAASVPHALDLIHDYLSALTALAVIEGNAGEILSTAGATAVGGALDADGIYVVNAHMEAHDGTGAGVSDITITMAHDGGTDAVQRVILADMNYYQRQNVSMTMYITDGGDAAVTIEAVDAYDAADSGLENVRVVAQRIR